MTSVFVVLRDTPSGCQFPVAAFPTKDLAEDYVGWHRGLHAVDPNYLINEIPFLMEVK